jgi:hypothetical protein
MVSTELINNIIDASKIDVRVTSIPNALPVYEVNPKLMRDGFAIAGSLNNATSVTILTASTTGKTYIDGFQVAWTKDASATTTAIYVSAIISIAKTVLTIPLTTLRVGDGVCNIMLRHPLLIDKGSILTLNSLTNVANFTAGIVVYGHFDEVI